MTTARLQQRYQSDIVPELKQKLQRTNPMALPKLEKIIINMGVGSAITDKKHLEEASAALAVIAGQKPLICRARKSISNFRLREGYPIGCKVTLRRQRMYEFLDRLINLALPRVRDFRGLSPHGFDGHGNYSFGLAEQLVFPEVDPDRFSRPQGMNITFVTSTEDDEEGRELLRQFGFPFRDEAVKKRKAAPQRGGKRGGKRKK